MNTDMFSLRVFKDFFVPLISLFYWKKCILFLFPPQFYLCLSGKAYLALFRASSDTLNWTSVSDTHHLFSGFIRPLNKEIIYKKNKVGYVHMLWLLI